MTLAEIKELDRDVITPAQAAGVLNCNPHWIRLIARQQPELLGFPVTVIRSRVKIPRVAFILYMEGGTTKHFLYLPACVLFFRPHPCATTGGGNYFVADKAALKIVCKPDSLSFTIRSIPSTASSSTSRSL